MKTVKAVFVTLPYRTAQSKWLDGAESRHVDGLEIFQLVVGDTPVELHVLKYDWQHAFSVGGETPRVSWNNRNPPGRPVIDAMLRDLAELARAGYSLCLWEEAIHCYPAVAVHLKQIFAHSVLLAANDNGGCAVHSVGWTAVATGPSAGFFNSVIHGNTIWKNDGSQTSDMYRSLGVSDLYYATQPLSPSFGEELTARNFTFEARIQQLHEHRYSNDLAFVGGLHGDFRFALNTAESSNLFQTAELRTRIYGAGMRDGLLLPQDAVDMWGRPVAALYLDSFATVNLQFIGLMSMRQYDAWESGTLLLQRDPVGELDEFGIKNGVHYVEYDLTVQDLIVKIKYYQAHMSETQAILLAGRDKGRELREKYNRARALEQILEKHWHKWGW